MAPASLTFKKIFVIILKKKAYGPGGVTELAPVYLLFLSYSLYNNIHMRARRDLKNILFISGAHCLISPNSPYYAVF